MGAVNRSVAEQEVQQWLDYKKVRQRKREANKDTIESMIDCFEDGILVLDHETHEIRQIIQTENFAKKEIIFKPRLKVGEIHNKLKNVGPSEIDKRVLMYISALTGELPGLLKDLETEDYGIASNIVTFFF